MAASASNSDPDGLRRWHRPNAAPSLARAVILAAGIALPVWLAAGVATWALLR